MRDNPEIACTGCGFGGESAGPVGFYDLGDEIRCEVHRVTAYCCAEGRLRAGEKLLDVEEYEEALAEREALADVEEEDEITGFLITRDVRAERIASARAVLAWRRQRTSPPRCLRCGSTDVVPLERGEQTRHPGCPGKG